MSLVKRVNIDMLSRYEGCLVGLACGDAVGTTVEFKSRGSFTPVTDMVGGGPFRLKAGQWTDDTSMALCLAESLIEKSKFDPGDQLDRYVKWWKRGHLSSTGSCFDIGGTVGRALMEHQVSGAPYCGQTERRSAGNGSIMRLAPVPMFYGNDMAMGIERCGDSSRTTHGLDDCVDACRYFGGLIMGALKGESKATLLENGYSPMGDQWKVRPLTENINMIALGSFKDKQPPDIKGSGYVVASLEAALWAFYHSETFESGCLMAVNLGDDADTTAAVYGQIAGAYYGLNGIPISWRERLAMSDIIMGFARKLYHQKRLNDD